MTVEQTVTRTCPDDGIELETWVRIEPYFETAKQAIKAMRARKCGGEYGAIPVPGGYEDREPNRVTGVLQRVTYRDI